MRILTLLLLMIPSFAFAQLSQNLFIDTKAMSLGNAVTADPVGIMNIHFNPAGLTKLEGRQLEIQVMNIMLSAEALFALPDDYRDEHGNKDLSRCGKDLLDVCDDKILDGNGYAKSKTTAAAFLPGVGIMPADLPISPLPKGGVSINPVGSKFTFANAAYIPMAAGFAKEDDDPGRYQAKQVALQRFAYLSPSFGYKVSDTLSVGAGFIFAHQAVAVKQNIRAPSVLIGVLGELQKAFGCFDPDTGEATGNDPLAPIITLCGGKIGPYEDVGELTMVTEESLSPSINLGLLWEPTDWFAFGVGYQGGSKARLKGTFDVKYTDDFSGFFRTLRGSIVGAIAGPMFGLPIGLEREKGKVSVDLEYPQHVRTGIKLRAFDRLQLNIDAGWTDLDKWDALEFQFDRSVSFLSAAKTMAPGLVTDTSLKQEMNYESVWSFAFGLAYDLNSRTQLRMGFEPRATSIPEDGRSVQAPLGKANLYSVGLGYQWDLDTTIDLSLSFLQSKEDIYADPINRDNMNEYPTSSNAINRNCLTCSVSNPYPGLDVHTKLTIGALGFTYRTRF